MNKHTVYVPKPEVLNEGYSTADFNSLEAYVFTPEELKQLLSEYTNRIVENTKITNDYGSGGELFDCIDKESITSQLPKFLKEKGI
jgi:hypothetical protein